MKMKIMKILVEPSLQLMSMNLNQTVFDPGYVLDMLAHLSSIPHHHRVLPKYRSNVPLNRNHLHINFSLCRNSPGNAL